LLLAFLIVAARSVVRLGLPTNLALYIVVATVLIPVELGYLFYQGRKSNGTFSLRNIVLFREPMPWWQYMVFLLPCVFWVLLVFFVVGPPINRFLVEHPFHWVPEWFTFNSGNPNAYSQSALLLLWGFYFITNVSGVFVEELYFRGYLLPRISHLGLWAPMMNVVLFSLYHFFTPWENITRILASLPCIYLVWWKRNIYLSIVLHLSVNTFGLFMMLLTVLGPTDEGKEIVGSRFRYSGEPAFTVAFPEGTTTASLDAPDQVFAARTAEGVVFQVAVADIPEGQALDQAARGYVESLDSDGSDTDITITFNAEISLKDGTRAYRSEVRWLYLPTRSRLKTQMVAAHRDGRLVHVTAHPQTEPERLIPIVESLRFD